MNVGTPRLLAAMLAVVVGTAPSLVFTSEADAVVICAKKRNPKKVKLRGGDTCRKSENPVSLSTSGSPEGLVVRDAEGELVGIVMALGDVTIVTRQIGSIRFSFKVDGNGFVQENDQFSGNQYYAEPSCSGAQLVAAYSANPLARRVYVLGNTGYFAADPIREDTAYSLSTGVPVEMCEANGGNPVPGGCCFERSSRVSPVFFGQTGVLDLTTLGLVPPFRVEEP